MTECSSGGEKQHLGQLAVLVGLGEALGKLLLIDVIRAVHISLGVQRLQLRLPQLRPEGLPG